MQVEPISSNLQSLIKNSIFSLDHDTGINCDGSFRLFQENTSVTCSIYGPRESVVQKRSYEKGSVEVQIKQFQDLQMKELRYYEQRIRLFLEDVILLDKYPRNLLTFVLIIHNDDGSLLSALMNSCMLALLFNGISLKQTIWTVDLTILEEKNNKFLHLYPSKAKGKIGNNSVHIGLDLVQSNVATFDTEGLLNEDLFESIYQISSELVPVLRQSIKRYIAEIVFE